MKVIILTIALTAMAVAGRAQDSLSLGEAYRMAYTHYPVAQNVSLQQQITDLNIRIAHSGYFPDLELNGRAGYQSEVTDFSLAGGMGPPPISKDQYEVSLQLTQNLYSGGVVGIRKELEQLRGERGEHAVEVDLHQVRRQVDRVYFGILLSREQAGVTDLMMQQLRQRLRMVRSQVDNGVLLPSERSLLQAELMTARQDSAEIAANIRAGYRVLGRLTGMELRADQALSLPELPTGYRSMPPMRPEYDLFESDTRALEKQVELAETAKKPKLSAFGSAALGRPGFNMLENDLHDYYMVGVRLRFDIKNWLNSGLEAEALQLRKQQVDHRREAFTRQLQATVDRLQEEIAILKENIVRDEEIIRLRRQVVDETASQLDNGVTTVTRYVTELTRAHRARRSLSLHRIQLARAEAEYATALGISLP